MPSEPGSLPLRTRPVLFQEYYYKRVIINIFIRILEAITVILSAPTSESSSRVGSGVGD